MYILDDEYYTCIQNPTTSEEEKENYNLKFPTWGILESETKRK